MCVACVYVVGVCVSMCVYPCVHVWCVYVVSVCVCVCVRVCVHVCGVCRCA